MAGLAHFSSDIVARLQLPVIKEQYCGHLAVLKTCAIGQSALAHHAQFCSFNHLPIWAKDIATAGMTSRSKALPAPDANGKPVQVSFGQMPLGAMHTDLQDQKTTGSDRKNRWPKLSYHCTSSFFSRSEG